MRSIVTLSFPKEKTATLKKKAKQRGFKSVSEYLRFLVDLDEDLISQDDILSAAKQAEKDYKTGRLKKIKSLAELV